MNKKKIVVIGGGTGTYTVLQGLKQYREQLDISAIVTMADSGGSTGRLRDEFGFLPVGDVRMALAALASDTDEQEGLLRELFMYRFDKGEGLSGHNFGNLLLVTLTDILGTEEEAIQAAGKLLRVCGKVIPVTSKKVDLVALYDDGVSRVGEHNIDEPTPDRNERRVEKLKVSPPAMINEVAKTAILEADLIVLGPGDLYTSVLANCVVGGVSEAILNSSAQLVYVCNLMTKSGQTFEMGVFEHVTEITKYSGRKPDVVLVNDKALPKDLLEKYAAQNEFPVIKNEDSCKSKIIQTDLLATAVVKKVGGDMLKRSLIRHDSDKLARELMRLL